MAVRVWTIGLICCLPLLARADDAPPAAGMKVEHFDHDPGWEAFNNRVAPTKVRAVTQDFGYRTGEIGGTVMRAGKPAYCAADIGAKTLHDKLSASGTFAITSSTGNSGIFFGYFDSHQRGSSGRPVGSLGFDFDGESLGGRLAVRLITADNQSCGSFVTPFIPGKYRPTPIHNDGTRYHWTLDYDPDGAAGKGQLHFRVSSDLPTDKHEEWDGKEFTVDLTPGFKDRGTTFDRFGLMNAMKAGGTMGVHFSDLKHDGVVEDLSQDPHWIESGNRSKYEDRDQVGAHDFGYSPATNFAGGAAAGEVGGGLWRSGNYAFYADRVGPLNLNDRLEAHGKVVLQIGSPDSDMHFGWFSGAHRDKSPVETGDFIGVHIGGPTRIGHYFQPAMATSRGTVAHPKTGPVLKPGKVYDWSFVYDPDANDHQGQIKVTLGDESVTLPLRPGLKTEGATLDHFGLLSDTLGGQLVKVYFDDITYTSAGKAK